MWGVVMSRKNVSSWKDNGSQGSTSQYRRVVKPVESKEEFFRRKRAEDLQRSTHELLKNLLKNPVWHDHHIAKDTE
jgi:hypothetical protein